MSNSIDCVVIGTLNYSLNYTTQLRIMNYFNNCFDINWCFIFYCSINPNCNVPTYVLRFGYFFTNYVIKLIKKSIVIQKLHITDFYINAYEACKKGFSHIQVHACQFH